MEVNMAKHIVKIISGVWQMSASMTSEITIDGIPTTVRTRVTRYNHKLKLSFGSVDQFGYRLKFSNKLICKHPDYKNIRKYVLAALYPKSLYWEREHEAIQSLKK
jgi:hypothetical protein